MALTLLEQAKTMAGTEVQRSVVEIFARSTPILEVLPFRNITGNSFRYSRERVLPGVAFRGVNEPYVAGAGVLNPIVESLSIIGGEISVDNFIVQTEGVETRAVHEAMQIKAIAEEWQRSFIKGDSTANPREMDGMQRRVTGTQVVDAGATSGGDALSLLKLDETISKVMNPTHIVLSKKMRQLISAASRNQSVGGYVNYFTNEFGRRITTYDDLPMIELEDAAGDDTVLPFSEANPGGGSAASTSIYVVSMGPGMLEGIQNGGMSVRDLGEDHDAPSLKTRIEWYAGMTIQHGRAAARLRGIRNAAVTA